MKHQEDNYEKFSEYCFFPQFTACSCLTSLKSVCNNTQTRIVKTIARQQVKKEYHNISALLRISASY